MTNTIQKRYNRIARVYDFLDKPMEMFASKWREKLLSEAEGKVLEVGIGTGKNISYYPEELDVTGIDFSENMVRIARRKASQHPNVRVLLMDAEQMEFNDNEFDTVITSCVFCSVPDPVRGLREIRRVCRNGGKIRMLEHMKTEKMLPGKLMDAFNFIPLYLYGANINRQTYRNLIKAGFQPEMIQQEMLWLDVVRLFKITNSKK